MNQEDDWDYCHCGHPRITHNGRCYNGLVWTYSWRGGWYDYRHQCDCMEFVV